jgi:periplasmic protein TonB
MFNTLESNWDQSARRGRAALASFTIQAFSLSLLIAISMLWVERPPQVHWLQIPAPTAFTTPVATQPQHGNRTSTAVRSMRTDQIIAPRSVPSETPRINDAGSGQTLAEAPIIDVGSGRGPGDGISRRVGNGFPIVVPARPAPVKLLLVSHWAEGNLIYRVQPIYPPLARQARIQGTVELRAIVSKAGTIENLVVVSGHPMLVKSAIEAVRQWRYRPYLLNGDPIEVETAVTVNFVLSGS